MSLYPKTKEFFDREKQHRSLSNTYVMQALGIGFQKFAYWAAGSAFPKDEQVPVIADFFCRHSRGNKSEAELQQEIGDFAVRLHQAIQLDKEHPNVSEGPQNVFDHKMKGLHVTQLRYPPLVGPLESTTSKSRQQDRGFLDSFFNRFLLHTAAPCMNQVEDLGDLLKNLVEDRPGRDKQSSQVGLGVMCTVDRLRSLFFFLTPIRIGLNAVVISESHRDVQVLRADLQGWLSLEQPLPRNLIVDVVAVKSGAEQTYLRGLRLSKGAELVTVDKLAVDAFVNGLLRDAKADLRIAITDEITCLRMIPKLRGLTNSADLLFPLASRSSVREIKRELPEYQLGICVNNQQEETIEFLSQALSVFLQTEIETLSTEYAGLSAALENLAAESLSKASPPPTTLEIREWCDYTLRLHPRFIRDFANASLHWQPILRRALERVRKQRGATSFVAA